LFLLVELRDKSAEKSLEAIPHVATSQRRRVLQ